MTVRRATAVQMAGQVDDLIAELKVAQKVLPGWLEQARLELHELTGRLPETVCRHCGDRRRSHTGASGHDHVFEGRGADHTQEPGPYYSDPTGEQVVHFRPARDGNCDPTEDLERYATWSREVRQLLGATRRLLNNTPAMTLAVVDGRKPTDGRSAEEHAQRRFVRVLSGEPCLVSQDHEETDRFGAGQLRRGMCDRHRKAFARWLDDNPAMFGLEAAERLVRWQMVTFGTVAGAGMSDDGDRGVYRKGLREVA